MKSWHYEAAHCMHDKSQVQPDLMRARAEYLRWCRCCKRLYSVGLDHDPGTNGHSKPATLDEARRLEGA